jgi:hypothetical protein
LKHLSDLIPKHICTTRVFAEIALSRALQLAELAILGDVKRQDATMRRGSRQCEAQGHRIGREIMTPAAQIPTQARR